MQFQCFKISQQKAWPLRHNVAWRSTASACFWFIPFIYFVSKIEALYAPTFCIPFSPYRTKRMARNISQKIIFWVCNKTIQIQGAKFRANISMTLPKVDAHISTSSITNHWSTTMWLLLPPPASIFWSHSLFAAVRATLLLIELHNLEQCYNFSKETANQLSNLHLSWVSCQYNFMTMNFRWTEILTRHIPAWEETMAFLNRFVSWSYNLPGSGCISWRIQNAKTNLVFFEQHGLPLFSQFFNTFQGVSFMSRTSFVNTSWTAMQ